MKWWRISICLLFAIQSSPPASMRFDYRSRSCRSARWIQARSRNLVGRWPLWCFPTKHVFRFRRRQSHDSLFSGHGSSVEHEDVPGEGSLICSVTPIYVNKTNNRSRVGAKSQTHIDGPFQILQHLFRCLSVIHVEAVIVLSEVGHRERDIRSSSRGQVS